MNAACRQFKKESEGLKKPQASAEVRHCSFGAERFEYTNDETLCVDLPVEELMES